jgi:hypothetical protein
MASRDGQSTDRENSKAPAKSVAVDDAVKSSSLGSLQSIALGVRPEKGEHKIPGTGGQNPGASIK